MLTTAPAVTLMKNHHYQLVAHIYGYENGCRQTFINSIPSHMPFSTLVKFCLLFPLWYASLTVNCGSWQDRHLPGESQRVASMTVASLLKM